MPRLRGRRRLGTQGQTKSTFLGGSRASFNGVSARTPSVPKVDRSTASGLDLITSGAGLRSCQQLLNRLLLSCVVVRS